MLQYYRRYNWVMPDNHPYPSIQPEAGEYTLCRQSLSIRLHAICLHRPLSSVNRRARSLSSRKQQYKRYSLAFSHFLRMAPSFSMPKGSPISAKTGHRGLEGGAKLTSLPLESISLLSYLPVWITNDRFTVSSG